MPLSKQLEKKIEAFYMDLSTFLYTRSNILSSISTRSEDMAALCVRLADREMAKATYVLCSNLDDTWIAGLYQAQIFLSRDNHADRLMLLLESKDMPAYQRQEAQSSDLLARVNELLIEVENMKKNEMEVDELSIEIPVLAPLVIEPDTPDSPWLDLECERHDARILCMAYGHLSQHSPNLEQALEYEAQAIKQAERLSMLDQARP